MSKRRSMALLMAAFLGLGGIAARATSGESSAREAFLAQDVIRAVPAASGIPLEPLAPAWMALSPTTVRLHPQTTVRLNDRITNKALAGTTVREARVRVLHDRDQLAVHVSWSDPNRSMLTTTDTDLFGDSVAIEVPLRFGAGQSLPYVGMGDDRHPVAVYFQRAFEGGEYQRRYVGEGFGSLTPLDAPGVRMRLEYDERARAWSALFLLPLRGGPVDLDRGLIPMAFAVWDGQNRERGGNKTLSSWRFIQLPDRPLEDPWLEELSWGRGPRPVGDAARGATLASQLCVACHRFGDQQLALEGMAPDLSSIGGISHPRYLRESIVDPSAVVVRNLNINRHYNVNGEQDRFRAFPNNELYTWYMKDAEGVRISKMPPFQGLPAQDIDDIVAYLMTLHRSEP